MQHGIDLGLHVGKPTVFATEQNRDPPFTELSCDDRGNVASYGVAFDLLFGHALLFLYVGSINLHLLIELELLAESIWSPRAMGDSF